MKEEEVRRERGGKKNIEEMKKRGRGQKRAEKGKEFVVYEGGSKGGGDKRRCIGREE